MGANNFETSILQRKKNNKNTNKTKSSLYMFKIKIILYPHMFSFKMPFVRCVIHFVLIFIKGANNCGYKVLSIDMLRERCFPPVFRQNPASSAMIG